MSRSSDSSYYTTVGSMGQPQNMNFTEFSNNNDDPENSVGITPEYNQHAQIQYDENQHGHVHRDQYRDQPHPTHEIYEVPVHQYQPSSNSDPNETPLQTNHFRPQLRENMVSSSPGSSSGWKMEYTVGIIVAVVVVFILGVWLWKRSSNQGGGGGSSSDDFSEMDKNTSEAIFGSGALSDLEFL